MWGIDGNAMNMAAFIAGALSTLIRPIRRKARGNCDKLWHADKAVVDFLNGAALVPFATLCLSLFWTSLLKDVTSNHSTMAAAGAVGFLFVAGEVLTAGKSD